MMNRAYRMVPMMMAGALGMGGALVSAGEVNSTEQAGGPQRSPASAWQGHESHSGATAVSQAAEVTVQSVLDDALGSRTADSTRYFQAGGASAGYRDNRFFIESDDGNFALRPSGLMQFRYVWNYRDGGVAGDPDFSRTESGFELTRARLGMDGHLLSPDLMYNIVFATGSEVRVLDAYAVWRFDERFAVRAGQFKDPVTREFRVGAGDQLAVERSLVDNMIGGSSIGRVQGVSLMFDDGGPLRAELGVHGGRGSAGAAFDDDRDYGFTGRAEYMVRSTHANSQGWRAYERFTAHDPKELLVLGGGVSWQRIGADNELYHTIDAQWNNPMDVDGLSLFAAFLGLHEDIDGGDNLYHWGVVAQAGYMVNESVEVFGRYGLTRVDDDTLPSKNLHEITAGAAYHLFHCSHAKLMFDVSWLPKGSPFSQPTKGILGHDTDDYQIVGRVQLQLRY